MPPFISELVISDSASEKLWSHGIGAAMARQVLDDGRGAVVTGWLADRDETTRYGRPGGRTNV
jgi:hypothetical protein